MTEYKVAEKFFALQGEGLYTGTPMAFIRFQGCVVGKKICTDCDTDFEHILPWHGGGTFSVEALLEWTKGYIHVCLTGGEPMAHDLRSLISYGDRVHKFHIETSGTTDIPLSVPSHVWVTVSPKPGCTRDWLERADELKIVVPYLGRGDGWMDVEDVLGWADKGKLVYLQPLNHKGAINWVNMNLCIELVKRYPQLRLSAQLHKLIQER